MQILNQAMYYLMNMEIWSFEILDYQSYYQIWLLVIEIH